MPLKRPFLPVIGGVAAACWALALFCGLIDPLDLYPWGIPPKLKTGGDYSMESTPYLADAVAKNPDIDAIFLGGSTGHFFTPRMMEEMLPGTRHAFNLSYGSPSAPDRAALVRQILRYSHARRLILEADWRYLIPKRDQEMSSSFPIYLYDAIWWNDVRGVDVKTIELSLAVLKREPLWIAAWSEAGEQDGYRRIYDLTHTPAAMAGFRQVVARQKSSVDSPSKLTCEEMDAIGEDLVPLARTLSARGAEVDVLIPIYSWFMYYSTGEQPDSIQPLYHANFLNDQLLMRRCLVRALDGLPRVHIFAFDDVPGLAADLRNYFNPGHLYNAAANRYILQSIGRGEHRLTRENIELKNSEMRRDVVGYELTSEKVWTFPQ